MRALAGVDFEVRPGEVHCIVGPNGAGKSTLIKCIAGVVDPTDGEILLDGEPLTDAGTRRRRSAAAWPRSTRSSTWSPTSGWSTTSSWATSSASAAGSSTGPACAARRPRCCARIGHESIAPTTRVSDLRPAGQQVVSIARSLSHEVRLLIMDEPSAILDDSEIETLFEVVRRLTAEGVGVVYISHRLDEIRRIGDRVTVLREGATVVSGLPASTPADELVTHMVGTAFEQLFPERATGGGRVLLEVRDLQRLPDVKAASFDLHAGEVLGIAGLVGAGRSELLRAIYGVDRRDSGEVVIDGEPLPPGRPDRAIAAGMGLAPEDRKSQALLLEWDLTKNVTLPDVARFQRGVIRVRAEREAAETQLAGAAHDAVRREPAGPPALGRQPAEGRAGPLAAEGVQGAPARRAHARASTWAPRRSCSASSPTWPARASASSSSRRRSRSSSACARGSSSCARASWSPSSTAPRPPSSRCCATPCRARSRW